MSGQLRLRPILAPWGVHRYRRDGTQPWASVEIEDSGRVPGLPLRTGTSRNRHGTAEGYDRPSALNIQPDGFSDDDEALAMDLAGVAGSVLGNVSAYWTVFDLSQNLTEATKTRAVIGQAKGVALELDMVQYDTQDGPCFTAFRSTRTVRVNLVEHGDAFPDFAQAARRRGFQGVLSVPATWGDEVVATLNLYSRSGPFDESAESIASVLAAPGRHRGQPLPRVRRRPWRGGAGAARADDDADVNVATGLLMVNEACTAEQAEGLLRQAANRDERTILEIAQRIIQQHHTSR